MRVCSAVKDFHLFKDAFSIQYIDMEYRKTFIEAIHACNLCILKDDKQYWYPKILRIEGRQKMLEIDGEECALMGSGDDAADANCHALMHLMKDKTRICAIYAYPVKCGIKPVDIIVGFMDKNNGLTLAWDKKRVLPMIGNPNVSMYNQRIPPDTTWIVAAAFETKYRHAISLFSQNVDQETIKKTTPVF